MAKQGCDACFLLIGILFFDNALVREIHYHFLCEGYQRDNVFISHRLLMEELVSYKDSGYSPKSSTSWKSKQAKRYP